MQPDVPRGFDPERQQRFMGVITATTAKTSPGGEHTKFRFSHLTSQQAKARCSAWTRVKRPLRSAIFAVSSKKDHQFSADQPSPPGRSSATTAAL